MLALGSRVKLDVSLGFHETVKTNFSKNIAEMFLVVCRITTTMLDQLCCCNTTTVDALLFPLRPSGLRSFFALALIQSYN